MTQNGRSSCSAIHSDSDPLPLPTILATATLVCAASFPATRVALQSVGEFELNLYRFAISTVVLVGLALLTHAPRPAQAEAAVIVDTIPIFTAFLGTLFLRQRMKAWGSLGTFVGFAGAALIAMGAAGETRLGLGVFWLLFSAVAFAVSIRLQKSLVQRYGSLATTAWGFFLGTLALLWLAPSTWTQIGAASGPGHAAVLQLALGPGVVAFVC